MAYSTLSIVLQRARESLALLLIALLPFHAFLTTVLTKWIAGPGRAPLGHIAIWKEAVLGIILAIAVTEMIFRRGGLNVKNEKLNMNDIHIIDWLIIALLLLGIVVSLFNSHYSILNFIYGFRYDFVPLVAFLVLRRVPWSEECIHRLMRVLLWVGMIVALLGIVGFFLPVSFFTLLGYSDLHSLYVPGGPIAPFQYIGGSAVRRMQSVMSGPNQLGMWLLVPLSLSLAALFRGKAQDASRKMRAILCLVACIACLVLTFSRAAWIGAMVVIAVALWPALQSLSRRYCLYLVSCILCVIIAASVAFPSVILRVASSRGHIENPLRAIATMIEHPFGLGLGSAGPASNRTSDSCVYLEEGSNPSWAADRQDLCVFVGGEQVQPADRACECPFLPENWYLQIGVEMGIAGLALYAWMMAAVLVYLAHASRRESRAVLMSDSREPPAITVSAFLSFIALSVAALFLHAFEDAAVAYTLWIMIAIVMARGMEEAEGIEARN